MSERRRPLSRPSAVVALSGLMVTPATVGAGGEHRRPRPAAIGEATPAPDPAFRAWSVITNAASFEIEGPRIELLGLATCPDGTRVVGGGGASFLATSVPGREEELMRAADVPLVQSRPARDGAAWIVKATGPNPAPSAVQRYELRVQAICVEPTSAAGQPGERGPRGDSPPAGEHSR